MRQSIETAYLIAGFAMTTDTRLPSRFCNLAEARDRFGDRVDRIGPYLLAGDPLADAAVAALAEMPGRGNSVVDAALRPDSSGAETPPALRAVIDSAALVPPWVEWDRIERGGRFFLRTGIFGGIVLGARALILGYASPAGNKPLALSGRLRESAAPRLQETARFVQAVVRPGGMRPGGEGFRITLRVRLMHAQVRRMILASDRWNTAAWGLPINQHDMVATCLLFSVITLEGLRLCGVDISQRESDDFMHLWRFVSHVIGVDPALVPVTESDGQRLGELIAATQGPADDDSRALTAALLDSGLSHPDDRERRRAQSTRGIAHAVCRKMLGDELADQLGVKKPKERFLVAAAAATVKAIERARPRVARMDDWLVEQGGRYWDEVLKKGLVYATTDFHLPERLAAQPA